MQHRIAAALLLLLAPVSAQACRCLPLPSDHFETANKVVTARITKVDRAPFDGPQTIELTVEETWKGTPDPKASVELHTQNGA